MALSPGGRRAEVRPAPTGFLNPYGRLATLLEPSLSVNREPAERVRAIARSLRVLNALQARGPAGDGQVPPLEDLGLPAEATTDPFNGEPLHVKKSPRGWTVYSVGGNGVDDGGAFDKAADIGVGPGDPHATPERPDPTTSPGQSGIIADEMLAESYTCPLNPPSPAVPCAIMATLLLAPPVSV